MTKTMWDTDPKPEHVNTPATKDTTQVSLEPEVILEDQPTKEKQFPPFEQALKKYLDKHASENPPFAEKYANPKLSIEKCAGYIYKVVQDSNRHGFTDSEVYGIALHYYQEEITDEYKGAPPQVVINEEVQLTEEEIAQAKKEAREKIMKEYTQKFTQKPKSKAPEPEKKEDNNPTPTLFG